MSEDVGKAKIVAVISLIILLACTQIIVDQVQGVNTTSWNFTGHEGAIVLLGLVPFIWVAGILLSIIIVALKG